MASPSQHISPNVAAADTHVETNSQPSQSVPHQQLVTHTPNKNALIDWFWSFSSFITWILESPLRWFAQNEKYTTLNNLDSALSILRGACEDAGDISFQKSVESVLSKVMLHKDEIESYNKEWEDLMAKIHTMHIPLVEFRQSLEGNAIYELPDGVKDALLSFCSHLRHAVVTQRRLLYEQNHITAFFRHGHNSLVKEGEMCRHETMLSLDNLNVRPHHFESQVICEIPLPASSQDTTLIDIAPTATPRRYRFIDCTLFIQKHILRIEECLDFPQAGYSVISYVWRGKSALPGAKDGRLAVKGAEHADPISIEVLNHACTASLKRGFPYMWVDRLCIIQSSNKDKNWQIGRMFRVYQSSSLCVVLTGGMQRLVRLDEETTWIHRGWTLQEALAPAFVLVLFAWALGTGEGQASVGIGGIGLVEEVIPQQSATASLSLVLDACTLGYLSFTGNSVGAGRSVMVKASIFSDLENHSYNDPPFWQPQRKVLAPNVTALAYILNLDQAADTESKNYAIWKSALMRTSSRPVDMVFSIMGLFGVILDTGEFNRNDRLGATIALATEILKKGGTATWLGASFQMEPSRQLSTFSTFPQTSVSGKALVLTKGGLRQVSQLVDSEYPYGDALLPMPGGSMDIDGYFHFSRKAICVVPAMEEQQHCLKASKKPYDHASKPSHVRAVDKSVWEVEDNSEGREDKLRGRRSATRVYMVLLGWFNEYYPGGTSAHDADNIRAILVEEHAAERYHLRSFVFLARQSKPWVLSWAECPFAVGGPQRRHQGAGDARSESQGEEPREMVVAEDRFPFPTSRQSDISLRDEMTRKSRWAVDQRVLERQYAVVQDK